MSVICPVCKFDNPDEETVVCGRCGLDFIVDADDGYVRALKMLKDMGNSLSNNVGSIGKDKLEGIWEHIASQIRDAIALSKEDFNKAFESNCSLSVENLDELPDGDSLKSFITNFSTLQAQIDEGLEMAHNALLNMRDINNLKTGKSQLELAASQIQQACESMQMMTASLVVSDSPSPPSLDISLTMSNLNSAIENIGQYVNSNEISYLRTALPYIENSAENLRFILNEYAENDENGENTEDIEDGEDTENSEDIANSEDDENVEEDFVTDYAAEADENGRIV